MAGRVWILRDHFNASVLKVSLESAVNVRVKLGINNWGGGLVVTYRSESVFHFSCDKSVRLRTLPQ